ncbi:hypothetical protein F511_30753 [Dorcoceras hygrometricum]|uniref:Uncharacterized protein n=1 Tax=Dorcoceras hygrometricum TaxID=472368 RepID=A0A2Z7BP80_9LAMI|nr:hypothetical protein F511_30753 [Dorcoceras hygrometricum]
MTSAVRRRFELAATLRFEVVTGTSRGSVMRYVLRLDAQQVVVVPADFVGEQLIVLISVVASAIYRKTWSSIVISIPLATGCPAGCSVSRCDSSFCVALLRISSGFLASAVCSVPADFAVALDSSREALSLFTSFRSCNWLVEEREVAVLVREFRCAVVPEKSDAIIGVVTTGSECLPPSCDGLTGPDDHRPMISTG